MWYFCCCCCCFGGGGDDVCVVVVVVVLYYYGCMISSITSNLRKLSIPGGNRNADKYTKAYKTILKASKGSQTFYKVRIGKADKANTCTNLETLFGTDIC